MAVCPFPTDSFLDQGLAALPEPERNQQCPLSGATLARLPTYQRSKDPAWLRTATRPALLREAVRWARAFFADTVAVKSRTNLHACTQSCFKYDTRSGGAPRLCHHNFFHVVCLLFAAMQSCSVCRGKSLVQQVCTVQGAEGWRQGKVLVVRQHPFKGSLNPYANTMMHCNVDVQCMQRVPVWCWPDEVTLLFLVLEATGHVSEADVRTSIDSVSP